MTSKINVNKEHSYEIVYILGPGHSGSTLIDMAIGSSEEAFSMGELAFYGHYLNKIPHIKIDNTKGFMCTCGKHAWICPFWKAINDGVLDTNPIIKNRGYLNTIKIFINIMNPFESICSFKLNTGKNKKILKRVSKNARKQKKQVKYLIDSSKDPRRLYELLNDPEIDGENILVLYLVRDVRAYINSYRKDIANIEGLNKRSVFMTTLEWIGVHVACRKMIKKYSIKHRVIKYHDFARYPRKYFGEIYKFLDIKSDLDVDKVLRKINRTEYHNLHGNPIRFKKIREIKYDQSWRDELGPTKRILATLLLYPFNRFWVFNRTSGSPFVLK